MIHQSLTNVYRAFTRRKPITDSSESKLAKVLSTFDLTALGIGSTLGVGVYVLAGEVAKKYAGPAVIISFLIAAIASVFAGLCYAEFGARVPKAGSAYVYSYVTIGEFIAFIIGWNLILEYSIGSASVVKGISTYLDKLCDHAMSDFMTEHLPMNVTGLNKYPDFFSFGVVLLFTCAIAFGAKESTAFNNVFTVLNLCVVLFVVIAGSLKADPSNWMITKEQIPEGYGTGGFMPYGIAGVVKGAAICFYGFIGFDCIATAGEEAKNPRKSIPFAVIVSLALIFLAYFSISSVLTMMLPYYEQDPKAPLPHVFRIYGWVAAEYIVIIGAVFGLCASLMGSMFPLPRIVFAMASDGLLYKFMGEINPRFKTPFNGTLLTGFLTACLATIFDLDQLVSMMSIGTLLAYSMVAGCVLILRYEYDDKSAKLNSNGKTNLNGNSDYSQHNHSSIAKRVFKQCFNLNRLTTSTLLSSNIATYGTTIYCVWCLLLSLVLQKFENESTTIEWLDYLLLVLSSIPVLLTLFIISCQPLSSSQLSFKVPFVPWLPGLSILMNIFLMIKLDTSTWIRFGVWIFIGLIIYFSYGVNHSYERTRNLKRNSINENGKIIVSIPIPATLTQNGNIAVTTITQTS